jgi:hypothetical protein
MNHAVCRNELHDPLPLMHILSIIFGMSAEGIAFDAQSAICNLQSAIASFRLRPG